MPCNRVKSPLRSITAGARRHRSPTSENHRRTNAIGEELQSRRSAEVESLSKQVVDDHSRHVAARRPHHAAARVRPRSALRGETEDQAKSSQFATGPSRTPASAACATKDSRRWVAQLIPAAAAIITMLDRHQKDPTAARTGALGQDLKQKLPGSPLLRLVRPTRQ